MYFIALSFSGRGGPRVHDFPGHVPQLEADRAPLALRPDRDGEEPALDPVEPVDCPVLAGRPAGVLVAGGADGELVQPRPGVDRVVLPVPVAAHHEEVARGVVLEPAADLVALVPEALVGVVVPIVLAVGADERGG